MLKSKDISELKSWLKDATEGNEPSPGNKYLKMALEYIEELENRNEDLNALAERRYTEGRMQGLEDMARIILVEHEEAKHAG